MIRVIVMIYSCLLVCGSASAQASKEAKKVADALTGDDRKSAADNPQCKLYTVAEVGKYIGEPVTAGKNAALGTGCQWLAKDGSGDVIVAVVPARYHEQPKLAKGYRALGDVGAKGFVSPELDGCAAGAIQGGESIRVSVAGSGASEKTAIDLLKETLKRKAK